MECQFCGKMNEKALKYCNTSCQMGKANLLKKQAYLDGAYIGRHLQYRGWARVLLEENLKNECSDCGIGTVYNGKPLTLQADHIDGDATNNRLSNIRLLCPNCHSQTVTYGSKNIGNSTRVSRRKFGGLAQLGERLPCT